MSPFDNSPSAKQVLTSKETVNGEQRYGFFASELKSARKEWAKVVLPTFLLVTLFMFALLGVYFGSYYEQVPQAVDFSVEVVDLDSAASANGTAHPAILGPAMRTAIAQSKLSPPYLGWYEDDSTVLQNFRLSPYAQGLDAFEYAQQRVLNQDVWAVLIINANATSGVWAALNSGATWEPMGAMTFVYEEARNFYGTDQYVSRLGIQVMTAGTSAAATTLATQVLALGNASAVLAAAPTGSITGAFSYNTHNLRPFDMLGGIPATTVGTIYLIIFTFLISVTWNTQGMPLIQDKLVLPSVVLLKVLVPFVAYFWLSLHYSLLSLAFEVRFDRYFGLGGFVVYWMANWITMSALGFVMETWFLWIGPLFPFFLVFWVIMNVSVAFLDISDMATIFRYGYMLPIWNLVDASKCIIFATKDHLVQNFAVNLGWMVVWMMLCAITVIIKRRRQEAGKLRAKWEEMKRRDLDLTEEEARRRSEIGAGQEKSGRQ